MDLPSAPLIFAQSFSKDSLEMWLPFGGGFGGLRGGIAQLETTLK